MAYRLSAGRRAVLRGKFAGQTLEEQRAFGEGLVEEPITLDGLRSLVEATKGWPSDTRVNVYDTPFRTRIEVQAEDGV